jgi:hypothetical protein
MGSWCDLCREDMRELVSDDTITYRGRVHMNTIVPRLRDQCPSCSHKPLLMTRILIEVNLNGSQRGTLKEVCELLIIELKVGGE